MAETPLPEPMHPGNKVAPLAEECRPSTAPFNPATSRYAALIECDDDGSHTKE